MQYTEEYSVGKAFRESLSEQLNGWIKEEQKTAARRREKRFATRFPCEQEILRREFIGMLGRPLTDSRASNQPFTEKTFVAECFGCRTYRVRYEVLPGVEGYGLWFEPVQKRFDKTPLVVCCHGGSGTPEVVSGFVMDSANYNRMVERACAYGVAVFAPQLYMWNQEIYGPEYDRQKTANGLTQLGGGITALELTLILRGVDAALAGEPGLDPERLGIIGLSYGGMYAVLAAVCDTRFRSVLSSCWLNDRAEYNWTDWAYFGQSETFFDAETAALVWPRALFVECGREDPTFTYPGAERAFEKLTEYYTSAGPAPLRCRFFEGVHELGRDAEGYEFFMKHLLK